MIQLLGNSPSLIQAADGLAITMVLLLGFAFGMLFTIFFVMAKNAGKKPEIEEPEDESPIRPVKTNEKGDRPEEWERNADWWKQ